MSASRRWCWRAKLSLEQIHRIADKTTVALEFFVHGSLCVSYSGLCNISHAQTGRSANRGDCSQACRLPYSLADQDGHLIAEDKHLLSLKDNNQSANLRALIAAGISSFKIEGRLKDLSYVKNITAYYRQELDMILADLPEHRRTSSGRSTFLFAPQPEKTFNRGSTDYFVTERHVDVGAFRLAKVRRRADRRGREDRPRQHRCAHRPTAAQRRRRHLLQRQAGTRRYAHQPRRGDRRRLPADAIAHRRPHCPPTCRSERRSIGIAIRNSNGYWRRNRPSAASRCASASRKRPAALRSG